MLSWSTHVSFTLCLPCSVFLSFILHFFQTFLHIYCLLFPLRIATSPPSSFDLSFLFYLFFSLSCWFTYSHSSFVFATVYVGGSDDCTITSVLPHIVECLNSGADQCTRQLEKAIIKSPTLI